jgi:DNA-binding protein HU-beta
VNKKDLVTKIASDARLTRTQAASALDAILSGIQAGLVNGNRVTISGFGTFDLLHRKARVVRNPRNGAAMEIGPKVVPRFAPSNDLRSAIQRRSAK